MSRETAPSPLRTACLAACLFAALLAAAKPAPAAESLGRLFFTPQQRQDLDYRRRANIQDSPTAAVESTVTVNGQVSRSSGRSTTWINGVPQHEDHRTRDPSHVTLGGNEGEAPVDLKVGQTLDKTRGEVKDELGGGMIIRRGGKADR
jgi:hypothetical protein